MSKEQAHASFHHLKAGIYGGFSGVAHGNVESATPEADRVTKPCFRKSGPSGFSDYFSDHKIGRLPHGEHHSEGDDVMRSGHGTRRQEPTPRRSLVGATDGDAVMRPALGEAGGYD
jgi:hypothetical protein